MISFLSKHKSYILTLLLTLGVVYSTSLLAAPTQQTLGFQGEFFNYGTPGNAPVQATFTFHTTETGNTPSGSTITKIIPVVHGYFATEFTDTDTQGVDFNQQLYLEISINGTTLAPRTPVRPSVASFKTFGTFSHATPPTPGIAGSLYFNTTTNELYVSTGSSWQLAGTASTTIQWTPNGTSLNYMAGNVGVGTSTPVQKLTVSNGSIGLDNTTSTSTGVIYKNGVPFLHNYANPINVGANTFLGENSGNFTMQSGTSYFASLNTGVGANTLSNLTTGYWDTAIGHYALNSVTSGTNNVAVGGNTMSGLQTGVNNTALGTESLKTLVSGSSNTSVGAYSLSNLAGGANGNIALGYFAGINQTDGFGNIIIGYQINAASTTGSNQINIGNTYFGNTFTGNAGIGSSTPFARLSVTGSGVGTGLLAQFTDSTNAPKFTILDNGNVGIGTTTPTQKLDVAGSIDLKNGATSQSLNIFNTYTSPSNYEKYGLYWNSNKFIIGYQIAGAGTARNVLVNGGSAVEIGTGGSTQWTFNNSGMLLPYNDNTQDIGGSGNRIRNLHVGTNGYFGGNVGVGTTNPSQFKLQVAGSIGPNADNLYDLGSTSARFSKTYAVSSYADTFRPVNAANASYLTTLAGAAGISHSTSFITNGFAINDSRIDFMNSSASRGYITGGQIYFTPDLFNVTTASNGNIILNPGGTGNVGIGTTTPSEKLSVNGKVIITDTSGSASASSGALQVAGGISASRASFMDGGLYMNGRGWNLSGASFEQALVIQLNSGSGATTAINGQTISINTAAGSYTTADASHIVLNGIVKGGGHTITNASGVKIANINAGTNNSNLILGQTISPAGNFSIYNSSTYNNYFAGNLGIGTTTPTNTLSLSALTAEIGLYSTGGNANAIRFNGGGASPALASFVGSGAAGGLVVGQGAGDLVLGAYNKNILFTTASGGSSAQMTINAAGNVGIGTTTPTSKLSVVGTAAQLFEVNNTASLGKVTIDGYTISHVYNNEANPRYSINPNLLPTGGAGIGFASGASIDAGGVAVGAVSNRNLGFFTSNGTALAERMRIDPNGNVGIGTSTPYALLTVTALGTGYQSSPIAVIYGSIQSGTTFTDSAGNTITRATVNIGSNGGGFDPLLNVYQGNNNSRFIVTSGGNIGLGTTTPSAQLTTTGTVRFASLGSGGANLITDSLGNVTVSSDERLKDIQGDYISGLDQIKGIQPITYRWKTETGYDTIATYAGFSAQNVQQFIPEAVTEDSRGFLTLADRPILATLVNAVKELGDKVDSLSSWFNFKNDEFCVEEVCMTKQEFKQMMIDAKQRNIPTSIPSPEPTVVETNNEVVAETPEESITPEPIIEPTPEPAPTE